MRLWRGSYRSARCVIPAFLGLLAVLQQVAPRTSRFASIAVTLLWLLAAPISSSGAKAPGALSYSFGRFFDEFVSPKVRSRRDETVCRELPGILNDHSVGSLACLTELAQTDQLENLEWKELGPNDGLRLERIREGRTGSGECEIASTDRAPHPRTAELIAQGQITFQSTQEDFDRDGVRETWLRRTDQNDPCGLAGVHLYYACKRKDGTVTDVVQVFGLNAFAFQDEVYTYSWNKLGSGRGYLILFHLNPSSAYEVAQICRINYM